MPPLVAAQVPKVSITCGSVTEVRIMYGDLVITAEVAAFITTMNFFASAETSPAAMALGVSAKPARMSTLSRTTSSCDRRLATSGGVVRVVAPPHLRGRALGDVGGGAADVLGDDLDLLPGDGVAVHLHVG